MRPAIEQHRAELQRNHAQGKLLQHRGRNGGMFARQSQVRLDLFFPGVEILLHLAGEDLAELGIDAADVGGQRLNQGQQNHHRNGKPAHDRRLRELVASSARAAPAPCRFFPRKR